MSFLDQWLTSVQQTIGVVVTAAGAYFVGRGRQSKLRAEIAKDRAGERILTTETSLQIGWLQGLVEGQKRDAAKIQALEKKLEDQGGSRVNDARMLERKDAELVACRERTAEIKIERDLAVEDMVKAREMLAAEREHGIVIEGQMLSLRIANAKLFSAVPDGQREGMIELLLKPESKP